MSIKLLDCTLRDGGHINSSCFGDYTICGIINRLNKSKTDYIEIGFLRTDIDNVSNDVAIFSTVSEAERYLPLISGNTELALMAQEDQYDISHLEPCNNKIKLIRVSFHSYDFEQGLDFCREVIQKGYQCSVNPINLPGYSDIEILKIIEKINTLHPFAFTIVDTFGSIKKDDLFRIYYLVENNLLPDIAVGLHLHENFSLSFSLAQMFLEIKSPKRDVMIDASLYGMGRVPGNLNIELMFDYMNEQYGTHYVTSEALEAIDDYIIPLRKKSQWGYSIEYALSAKHKMHRTYAEYLIKKGKLSIRDIDNILLNVNNKEKGIYNAEYIENLYIQYMNVPIEDKDAIQKLHIMLSNTSILLLAPGKSIVDNLERIKKIIDQKQLTVISINFVYKDILQDFVFCTNQKRYENGKFGNIDNFIIITSNIREYKSTDIRISRSNLIDHFGIFSDSSLLMILKLLYSIKIKDVYLAGFDGFETNGNFYIEELDMYKDIGETNQDNISILPLYQKYMNLNFVTSSIYNNMDNKKKDN